MKGINRSLVYSLINDCDHNFFNELFKDCSNLKSQLENTGEYKCHSDIYDIYSSLRFLFHGKYIDYSMKRSFFGRAMFVNKLKELIDNPSHEFLKIISRHVCYSKGYEESRKFINENYDFKLCSLGSSVNDYIENNLDNAMRVLTTTNGSW